ncbi:MAG: hypothetical protein ICCCNLDF_02058 [Planctomycetes bacterium]|nr:hypothetical protein [Planctomycetota bacterium]
MRRLLLLAALALAPCLCAQDDVRRGFDQLAQAHPTHLKVEKLPGLDNGAFSASIRDHAVSVNLPCVLLVGSLYGRERTAAEACLQVAREILEDKALRDRLSSCELVIIPCLAPDARAARLHGVALPFDDDRDGKTDEDGPSDLNGDGVISQLRVKRKGGRYVASANDPRILIEAAAGQSGEWDLYWEGKDDDGDGRINEDARGTITLANDWSIRWSDQQPGANRLMMQLVETRALAEFLMRRPSLVAGFQLRGVGVGPEFAEGPRATGKEDPLERDKKVVAALKKMWGEEERGALKGEAEGAGNLLDWLYESQGALAANLFLHTLTTAREKEDEGEDKPPVKREKPGEEEQRQAAWLAYSPGDYLEWKTFKHPQLGEVEIGGWRIDARCNPAEADVQAGASRVAGFLKAVLGATPRLEVSKVEVENKGDNLYRVRLSLHNAGLLDYRTKFSADKRIHLPLFTSLSDAKEVELLSGTRRQKHENVEADGTVTFEWFVRVKDSATQLKFEVESDRTGKLSHSVAVKDCPAITTEDE